MVRLGGERFDLVVAGAGIVGLAHAAEAVLRGLKVAVVERDALPRGASIRNFGHGCVSGQAGPALRYARDSRSRWLELGRRAGFYAEATGTVVAARSDEEMAVLREFALARRAPAEILDADQVRERAPLGAKTLVGGAFLPWDVRVNPREATHAIARWLGSEGVTFHWRTAALGVSPGVLHTSRGDLEAPAIVLAFGHDVDRLFPEIAERAEVRRCVLRMLRIAPPADGPVFRPGVLTGLSLLRYSGFADCPSLPALRERLESERPDLLDVDMNLMFTQLPDGDLLIGDTHAREVSPLPFEDERVDDLLLSETADLLGVPRDELVVRERWRGVYASAPGQEFLVESPLPGVRVVVVTTGIGMTTSHGLAADVLDHLLT